MLNPTTETSPTAITQGTGATMGKSSAQNPALLVSVPEARRQLGEIGKTCFYKLVKRHRIRLIKIGSLTRVPMAEIERVVADLIATAAPDAITENGKRLAVKSVAARRARDGP